MLCGGTYGRSRPRRACRHSPDVAGRSPMLNGHAARTTMARCRRAQVVLVARLERLAVTVQLVVGEADEDARIAVRQRHALGFSPPRRSVGSSVAQIDQSVAGGSIGGGDHAPPVDHTGLAVPAEIVAGAQGFRSLPRRRAQACRLRSGRRRFWGGRRGRSGCERSCDCKPLVSARAAPATKRDT